uniref:Poly(R)-hydroxyalkanoic acid synthase n=1 Tax=uncultured bacterium 50 TaxID=1748278 RepID=A0A0U3SMA3_9BACT|nr:poly(R)-hydroxyalkanoic acid synthase [uncultured bacterium 50]
MAKTKAPPRWARLPSPPSRSELLRLALVIFGRLRRNPALPIRHIAAFAKELLRVLRNKSEVAPSAGDKRFTDAAWSDRRWSSALVQVYLAASQEAYALVNELELDGRDASSARFLATMLVEAMAPSNNPLTNPVVMQRVRETKGRSLLRGLQHFISDRLDNAGMISMVDRTPFEVGRNVACTPGDVVFRNEVCEVLQYKPQTAEVYSIPLVVVPPQINKFYVLDLSPGNSFVNYAVKQGFQVFMVSWRNPGPELAYLSLQHYLQALEDAHRAVMEITGADKVNFKGLCAGGLTLAIALGRYADQGKLDTVNTLTLNVTLLDIAGMEKTNMGYFLTPSGLEKSMKRSKQEGVLYGHEMAKMFAWLRPNDLVWNYWVNNYLMGKKPAAFDVLFWNSDATRLPAALHRDFCELLKTNELGRGEVYQVEDAKVDLRKVDVDSFVVAGRTDHITPWDGCYKSVNLLGGESQFVLVNSGHIQTLVCPPGKGKASYQTGETLPEDPHEWLEQSKPTIGSWWDLWVKWASQRSGAKRPAPKAPGSAKFPPIGAAPGDYVRT